MYNKQVWKDEIPDLTKPILDTNGKQKTDPQTGRPLFELVQEGTRITSTRLNSMETGIGGAHDLVEMLAKELGGNFVASFNGAIGFEFSTKDLTVSWTSGIAYVGGRRFEVLAGSLPLNPTQGQYLYLDLDGKIKKTTSEAIAATALLLWYVATDASGVITSTDKRSTINMAEILKKIENITVPSASLTVSGITMLSNKTDGTSQTIAVTEKALNDVMKEAQAGKQAGNERKAEVVAVLVAKGIAATINDTWDTLIAKMAAIVKATGNAVPADLLVGKTATNVTGPIAGAMPNRSAENNHQPANSQVTYPGDRIFLSPPNGCYDGSTWVTHPAPTLLPQNVRSGVDMLGVVGTLVEGTPFVRGYVEQTPGTRIIIPFNSQTQSFNIKTIALWVNGNEVNYLAYSRIVSGRGRVVYFAFGWSSGDFYADVYSDRVEITVPISGGSDVGWQYLFLTI
ncbi:tail fiber protein [Paenibacillus glacialis]|uniref:Tail fiber protein n=1 Tax=Paenibacillus glacialis TaxID=494026 RepID=A0A168DE13_9BACL|nr:tail fiber protein [Paenibacillus glacialis]OAB34111.1 hypothetical protein PGLA_24765 [Paenibacillus glacialis]